MNSIIGFIILSINCYFLYLNEKKGLALFAVLSVVLPTTNIFGVSLFYDYLFFLPLILSFIIRHGIKISIIRNNILILSLWFIWMILVTIISTFNIDYAKINWISLFGTAKKIFTIAYLSNSRYFKEKFIDIIRIIVYINLIVAFIQYFMLQFFSVSYTLEILSSLYGSSFSQGNFNTLMEYGILRRLYGTFNNSGYLGTLSMLGVGIFFAELDIKRERKAFYSLLASIICGLLSASKRFFFGGLAILISYFIIRQTYNIKNQHRMSYHRTKLILLFSLLFMFGNIVFDFTKDTVGIEYYLNLLLNFNIEGLLFNRFSNEGVFTKGLSIVSKNLLVGIGDMGIEGETIVDSEFLVVLYRSGIIGLALYVILFFNTVCYVIKSKNIYMSLVLFIVLIEFIVSTVFYTNLGVLMVAYVLSSTTVPS